MKKILAIFLLISGSQCLPIEVEVAPEPEPVADLILEHRMMEEKPIEEVETEVRMIETKPEPVPEPTADKKMTKEKPVPMVVVVGEPEDIVKPLIKESAMDAKPEPMAANLVEGPEVEAVAELIGETIAEVLAEELLTDPMAAVVAEQPIKEAVPEPMAAVLVEEPMKEAVPEPMAVVLVEEPMKEAVPEPIVGVLVEKPTVKAVSEPMAVVLVEEPMVNAVPEPMAVVLVEEPMVEAVQEPMTKPLQDQMMMEDNMAQPLSVLMPEPMTEPIVYNIIDTEENYNHIQMGVPGESVQGDFAFKADGNVYKTSYTADDSGYKAVGDHLPKSPAIPDYPKLHPVKNTDEVEALIQVHNHFVGIQNHLIANTRNPVDSGVEVVRRRRSPVTVPEANMYNYIQPYPILPLQPMIPSLSYSQIPQPTLNLAHPTYNLGLAFNLPPALIPQPINQESSNPDLPNEVQVGEEQPAALAL